MYSCYFTLEAFPWLSPEYISERKIVIWTSLIYVFSLIFCFIKHCWCVCFRVWTCWVLPVPSPTSLTVFSPGELLHSTTFHIGFSSPNITFSCPSPSTIVPDHINSKKRYVNNLAGSWHRSYRPSSRHFTYHCNSAHSGNWISGKLHYRYRTYLTGSVP
jgi:hypothetical protein